MLSQRSSNTRVSAFVQHVDKAKDSIELPIRTKNTMILLYKTGFQVLNAIVKAVRPTLRLGHVNVKKVLDER
jgi:hypothetical protein